MTNQENLSTSSGEKTGAAETSEASSGENAIISYQVVANIGFGPINEQCRPTYSLRWWTAGNGRIPCTRDFLSVSRRGMERLIPLSLCQDTHPAIKLAFYFSCI
jgi:hypothetical protein